MSGERILVVEDDPSIQRGLDLNLGMEGYKVRTAPDGEEGLRIARTERPDLLIVDLMMPKLSGLELIRELRKEDPDVPILILSAKGQEADKVAGLALGADDYVVKPFGLKELLARIDAALRRSRSKGEAGPSRQLKRFGAVEIDLGERKVRVSGEPVEMTAREFDLLAFLVAHPGRVFTREQLTRAVWGSLYLGTERTVDNFVVRLRAHLGEDAERPRHLETVRGVGYRFNP
ncbi:MAG TPA: response regulator transcription factor [Anaeromyxobacteraceae bacterium]|nr:response regulator transcription factor [Anaeromyxobacteraceae bacterium]